ncbi:Beta-galactoside alpha-2,6-sialyltransferase 2 [Frankliniella fusca]|uniref:Beta-galactoside alpha-2,6-sialyltransferase 1 n=1 Tax=Frankliniella fusca TaxID=407009 RepID=A0AAE1LAP3_9NEOP|nr:Beta-galactoside alpha-2,6-sialyltransferase 2 [Frankliniella fusca]
MRAIAWSVWVFINFVFLGMCGFFYVLCSQYWGYVEKRHAYLDTYTSKRTNVGQHHIQYYAETENHSEHLRQVIDGQANEGNTERKVRASPLARDRHDPSLEEKKLKLAEPTSMAYKANQALKEKISKHKSQLMIQLRRVLHDESSVFKARGEGSNPYNVEYIGPRGPYDKKSARELVCSLKKKALVKMVQKDDEPFKSMGLGAQFPNQPVFGEDKIFESCAVVSSAGSLLASELGKTIDSHDVVLRFNHAPTKDYEVDVGCKTTVRIVNSQVISKPEFNYLESPLYSNIKIVAWDPSKYNHTMEQWYQNPDHDIFTSYFKHRMLKPETNAHILNPSSLWDLWDYIQAHMPLRIRRNPPSSGFLGLALLLPHCAHVDMFEFIPSFRMTKRCHYYDNLDDISCTFGVWHPLSAEKLLLLSMNIANDTEVFRDGYIRIPGYQTLGCGN